MAPAEGIANWTAGVLGLRSTVNDKCSHQHRRSVQAERSSCPGKTVISSTYAIWETRI